MFKLNISTATVVQKLFPRAHDEEIVFSTVDKPYGDFPQPHQSLPRQATSNLRVLQEAVSLDSARFEFQFVRPAWCRNTKTSIPSSNE